jgi:SAM-dependent methyltransferase
MSPALDYSGMADVYDALVRFEEDIPFFRELALEASGPVLELMAGTGRVSLPLIEAGVDLTCVDSSGEMLDRLRAKLEDRDLSARLIQGDIARLRFEPGFALALIPFQSLSELLIEDEQRSALRAVFDALRPDGLLACTLHNPAIRRRSLGGGPRTAARAPDGERGELLLEVELEVGEGDLVHGVQRVRRTDAHGKIIFERVIPIRFALIERVDFEAMARGIGFEVEALYGDYAGSPFSPDSSPYMVWLLRRPG